MLVLSRRLDETVVIDGRIIVTVVEIRPNLVRLGFDCPREVTVHRGEVQAAIDAEKAAKDPNPIEYISPGQTDKM
jgi:carbon storage regulator